MFDIEENERREIAAMMARDELPTPDEATRAALVAAGVKLGPSAPGCDLIVATLPTHWRKERADVDRAFWIVDDFGVRRFRVWWKAALPFSFVPGYGGVEVAKQRDNYARTWSPDDSFEMYADGRRHFEIACHRCRHRVRVDLSIIAERDDPRARPRAEEMAEHYFAREHPKCPAERAIAASPFASFAAFRP